MSELTCCDFCFDCRMMLRKRAGVGKRLRLRSKVAAHALPSHLSRRSGYVTFSALGHIDLRDLVLIIMYHQLYSIHPNDPVVTVSHLVDPHLRRFKRTRY